MRNTAMAVTIDIGNPTDVHPTDKLDVGLRLARAARALAYGEAVEYSGPMFRQATPEGGSIRAYFDHAAGLTAKGGAVTGIEIAGRDGNYVAATATIDGTTIVASSPDVPHTRSSPLRLGQQPAVQSVQRRRTARLALHVGEVAQRSERAAKMPQTSEMARLESRAFLTRMINFELQTKNSELWLSHDRRRLDQREHPPNTCFSSPIVIAPLWPGAHCNSPTVASS